ncbi:MAG: NAD(P)H-binding protein [Solirubrobacteraceae bacterium]
MIAVTGATGAVGGAVAARLAAAGLGQRLVVRDPARAPRLAGAEVRRASGYAAGDELCAALAGAQTLFLVPAAEAADRVVQHRTAVDAAAAAAVERIVYLSFVGAAPDATFTLAREHFATEQLIRATGLAFVLLRMNLYIDFIPSLAGPDGVIRGPAGDGRVAAILRDDVAAAAAAVLLAPGGHDGRTYALTGPESLTLAEAAGLLSRLGGRAVRFEDRCASRTRPTRRRSRRARASARRTGRCAPGSAPTRRSATAAWPR